MIPRARAAALSAALFAAILCVIPCRMACAQTFAYAKDATGKYTITVTFADGTVVSIPNLAGKAPVVTPPPAQPPAAPTAFKGMAMNPGTPAVMLSWSAQSGIDGF